MSSSEIFNSTATEYDEMSDLWYAWLYSRLHYIIARDVIKAYNPQIVLDVGCGTGLQSFLHTAGGACVIGIDIASELVKVAKRKSLSFNPNGEITLFPAYFNFVNRYNKLIGEILATIARNRNCSTALPSFALADGRKLPFPSNYFDHVNCCGSTLSLIEDHSHALSEIARVLKPGGTFFLEVEARWGADVFWMVIDYFLGKKLGFNSTTEDIRAIFTRPSEHIYIHYPFTVPGGMVYLKLKLFTERGLKRELSHLGFHIIRKYSIHSLTNIIPGNWLAVANPPKWMKYLFIFLAAIEERLPFYLPGSSIVLLAQKVSAGSSACSFT